MYYGEYLNEDTLTAQVGEEVLGAYHAMVDAWAPVSPAWTHQHPLRAFEAVGIFGQKATPSVTEYISITPYWPTYPGFPGKDIYTAPNEKADLDQLVSAEPVWRMNNPYDLEATYGQYRANEQEERPIVIAHHIHPRMEQGDVSADLQRTVIDLCGVLRRAKFMVAGGQPQKEIFAVAGRQYLFFWAIRPVFSRNVVLQGGEPAVYVEGLRYFLEGESQKKQAIFDGVDLRDNPLRRDFLGENWRLVREALARLDQDYPGGK